jgi:hypothetical protein
VIADGEDDDGALHMDLSLLRGRPGTRAPHVVIGEDRSTVDLFGRSFVLLRAAGAGADDRAPEGVEAHVIDADGFADAYGLQPGGASLVRPDGVVGWRSAGPPDRDDVSRALGAILAREAAYA